MFRITSDANSPLARSVEQLALKLPKADLSTASIGNSPNGPFKPISSVLGQTLEQLGFKNGELLFINYGEQTQKQTSEDEATKSKPFISIASLNTKPSFIEELAVDRELTKETGLIPRKRSKLCRHSEKGMCEYCSPLPPWDKNYREEHNIKHSSFHAHVKELDHSINKNQGSSYIPPLSEFDFKIKANCPGGHEPWPKGICSKCQPSAITLQQQKFRMVDHLEFASSDIINSFLESWRQTGTQRIGLLYGRYEKYDKVPLGIKGVAEAIYEPPQHDENDGLTLGSPWEDEEKIDAIAKKAGLQKIGVIFTDLTDSGNSDGTVICKRHQDSFFLSSLEVIFASKLQNKYPNYTKFSESGKFSSKFITCVISGNIHGQIEISPYQVSEGAQALTSADIITGSTHPSMAYINETNDSRYVPEIFYNRINEYNLQVKVNAKPVFPVEYLLVTLSHGFPQDPNPVFKSNSFPIENRQAAGISQDLHEVKKHLKIDSANSNDVIYSLSDFHLLVYLFSLGVLSESEQDLVIRVATKHNLEDAYRLIEQPGWQTLLTIMRSS
ncbi:hypothetical protein WICMUC_000042 [Wickerhamomyces mucosus]|uniref:Nuclear protein localization protein 4 n=1 Tax=Wickerhamomyces mucosus TaxID=1378264 RepID=A0A9P8TJA2_9ASCO|nr:hypothetical protein WICMUC_000042 [Wickerhamomyces mucosus]